MIVSKAFSGNYFKATDLPDPRVLIIREVVSETVAEGESKPVMHFAGEQQRLVLNKTNAFHGAELFGDDTTAWAGKQVELYATTTSFSGRMVQCVRLREPQQPLPAAAADYPVDA